MPLLRINATDHGLQLHEDGSGSLHHALQTCSGTSGPRIIMIHGYKYKPGHAAHCPHRKLFGAEGADWPAALGFGQNRPDEGLGIAFGWSARGSLRQAHARAKAYGQLLAQLVETLKQAAPHRPVHVIAHSLGSEIALSALAHLPPNAIDRMLLLTGASFALRAQDLLRTPAGRTAEVLNITSRENDIFDLVFETLARKPASADRAIGQGIDRPNAANIQIDCDDTLSVLATHGAHVARAERRICHWSSYTRPGVMALYATLLRQPDQMPLGTLQQALPIQMAPRWSRFAGASAATAYLRQAVTALMTTMQFARRKAMLLTRGPANSSGKKPAF